MAGTKIVVRRGFMSPSMGRLIREGPKTLKVDRIYGSVEGEMQKPLSQSGEQWPKSICFVLDSEQDADKIAAVEALVVRERTLEKRIGEMRDEYRKLCRTHMDSLFPAEKVDGTCPVCGAIVGCRYDSGRYVVPTHFTPTTGTRCGGAGLEPKQGAS